MDKLLGENQLIPNPISEGKAKKSLNWKQVRLLSFFLLYILQQIMYVIQWGMDVQR